jgi:hypothetical protein
MVLIVKQRLVDISNLVRNKLFSIGSLYLNEKPPSGGFFCKAFRCHPRESGDPIKLKLLYWIPACAGMTGKEQE